MAKKREMKATLRIKINNPGQRNVKYTAELILSRDNKFQLQKDLLTTELTVAVKDYTTASEEMKGIKPSHVF